MRKSYVTIEDMGTERQNAGYTPSFPDASMPGNMWSNDESTYGRKRTSISEIEREIPPVFSPAREVVPNVVAPMVPHPKGVATTSPGASHLTSQEAMHPMRYRDAQSARQNMRVDRTEYYEPVRQSCPDVAAHVANCPVCSRLYMPDPLVYYIIIAVLAVIIAMLLLQRRT